MTDTVLQVILRGKDDGATRELTSLIQAVTGVDAGMAGMAATALKVGGVILGLEAAFVTLKDVIGGAADASAKWETTLIEIANNTNISTEAMTKMGGVVQQIATDTGGSMDQIAHGFEHAQNVTQDFNSALAITKVATESAISTGANATDVTNLLANAMHEYGLDVSNAGSETQKMADVQANANQVMGAMHLATAESNTQLGSFTEATAKAVGIAANLGVSMNDVFAATSALTRHGFPDVYQAGTQVTDMLTHMMNPSKGSKDALLALAAASGDQGVATAFTAGALASNGLIGTLNILKQAMGDAGMTTAQQEAEMNKLIPALRGGLGAAALTGTAFDDMNKSQADLNNTTLTTTITQDSFNRKLDTTGGQAGILKAHLGELALEIGGPLNESAKSFLTTLNDMATQLQEMGTQTQRSFAEDNAAADQLLQWAHSQNGVTSAIAATVEGLVGYQAKATDAATADQKMIDANQAAGTSYHGLADAIGVGTAALNDWMAANGAVNDGLSGAMGSAGDVSASMPSQADAIKAQDAARTKAIAEAAKQADTATKQAVADAKTYYADQASTAKAAATATKDAALSAAQATLDGTKTEIAGEKTAYDDRAQHDIKDRQDQTQHALQELAKQNTAANVVAQAAHAAEVAKQAAIQKTADESDAAWKRQVTAIKDAADKGENTLHASNDALLKSATDTANDTYNAQIIAIDGEVKSREEGDARVIHSKELATAAAIAAVEQEKTAALRAVDEETKAYERQEAAQLKAVDATAAAKIASLTAGIDAEKTALSQHKAVEQLTKSNGAAAGSLLGAYFAADNSGQFDKAKEIAAQLSKINQTVADQMSQYLLQRDEANTTSAIDAVKAQAQAQKDGLAQQLSAFKDAETEKKQQIEDNAASQKASLQQQLSDFKWAMSQELQTFKDTEDQKKLTDKAALDTALTNIGTQQTAENTRHAAAIAAIAAQATADTLAIDLIAQKRKDDYTAATTQRTADYTAANAARQADYTAATQTINAASAADVAAIQASQKAADAAFAAQITAADAQFKAQQLQIDQMYQSTVTGIDAVQKENNTALLAMTRDTNTYATSANSDLQGVLASVDAINNAMANGAALSKAQREQAGHGAQFGTGNAGGTGGGQGGKLQGAGIAGPDGHNTGKGTAAVSRAQNLDGSKAYYHDGSTWCESFVEDVTGLPNMGGSAAAAADNWGNALLRGQQYPGPSLVYFDGPEAAGHVGISDGGNFTSVLNPPWNVTTESVGKFLADNPGASFLGSVPLYGDGTSNHPGGPAIVGERGHPELVNLPAGTTVTPLDHLGAGVGGIDYDRLARALAAQPIRLEVGGQQIATVLRAELLKLKRSGGLASLGLS